MGGLGGEFNALNVELAVQRAEIGCVCDVEELLAFLVEVRCAFRAIYSACGAFFKLVVFKLVVLKLVEFVEWKKSDHLHGARPTSHPQSHISFLQERVRSDTGPCHRLVGGLGERFEGRSEG